MFETFNVKGLYIAVQAVLALQASWGSNKARQAGVAGLLTGTVVDSGDGVTHVIPVVEGYVIGSAIRHIPLAGRDITEFVSRMLRDREPSLPPEEAFQVAQRIKEKHGYVCQNLAKEFAKYDGNMAKYIEQHEGKHPRTGAPYKIDLGYEKFLGPELFFNPEVFSSEFATPLPQVVDQVVQQCPIDTRRDLYRNIVLSGGSTMFKHFSKRLQEDLKGIVDKRITAGKQVDVNVISHNWQRYAVFTGASVAAVSPGFEQVCISKKDYDEWGPSIARHSKLFTSATF
jgi:actin-related protein 3